jgi:DNA-binding YbaB/EbfC family protein|tara:strand:- start:221 stop:526 length:306 start_codon:yes stop_codon:yes gene_type:complete
MNKKMIQQAQQMQARLKSMQDEIAQTIIESSAGGGVIKVKILGGNKIESISIDPNVVDPDDIEMLEDLITAAINEGMEMYQKNAAEKMKSITGGLNIPGMF